MLELEKAANAFLPDFVNGRKYVNGTYGLFGALYAISGDGQGLRPAALPASKP